MSNQIRQFLNQLSKTPSSCSSNSTNNKKNKLVRAVTNASDSPILVTPVTKLKRKRTNDTDSGLDTILSNNYTMNEIIGCNCEQCVSRNKKRIQLENTLKHAFVNYLREPSETKFANIPIMVVKSFRPTNNTKTKQLDQLEVKKANAVNALFMKDNKWVYVKTSDNVKGFIPKKILEPFYLKSCQNKSKNSTSSPIPKAPESAPPVKPTTRLFQKNLVDHTYMTINDNDVKPDAQHYDDMMKSEETDLNLFSVSSCLEIQIQPRLSKNLMKKFIECDSFKTRSVSPRPKNNSNSRDLARMLAKSKSRNRKISIAFRHMSNEATLTMLDNEITKNYINLNDCNAINSDYENIKQINANFSPVLEESSKISSKRVVNYENLLNLNSLKRSKKSDSSNSLSSSPSSIDYDVISYDYKQMNPSTPRNYYNVSSLQNDEDHVYDHLSSNNSKVLNVYKVIDDYTADFKGDLSVRRGDIVSLIESVASPNKNSDYLLVRIHKRNLKAASGYFTQHQIEHKNIQGYIPRSHVIKI